MDTRKYLVDRINEQFLEVTPTLADRLLPIKSKVKDQVRKELGIDLVEKRMQKLMTEVKDLNKQYQEITGNEFYAIERVTEKYYDFNKDSPAGREYSTRLNEAKESAAMNTLETKRKELVDQVMFAGASADLKAIADSIGPTIQALLPPRTKLLRAAQ